MNGIILPNQKLIYFWVPKNGCTTLKKIMADVQGLKYRTPHDAKFQRCTMEDYVRQYHGLGFTSFAIVRNPLARLVSLFRDKVRPGFRAWGFKQGIEDFVLGPYGIFYEEMTFQAFAAKCLAMPMGNANIHWKPQAPQISYQGSFPETIIRFEEFAQEVPPYLARFGIEMPMPRLNPSWLKDPRPWPEWYTPELLERAKEYYRQDLELFYKELL